MNFEELSMTWHTQDTRSVMTINSDSLHAALQRKASLTGKQVRATEKVFLFLAFLMAPLFLTGFVVHTWIKPSGNVYGNFHDLAIACLCIGLGVYAWRGYRRRRGNDTAIDQTMLNIVQRSVRQVDDYLRYARVLVCFYLIPLALISGMSLVFFLSAVTPWVSGATLICCVIGILDTQRDIRERIEPERKDLVYLLGQLLDEPSTDLPPSPPSL